MRLCFDWIRDGEGKRIVKILNATCLLHRMFPKIRLGGVQDKEALFRIRQILYGIRILFFVFVL
jgi:hypothetical protein